MSSEAPSVTAPIKPHIDPVCGMQVAANAEKAVEFAAATYYFCSQGCASKFKADPHRYLHKSVTDLQAHHAHDSAPPPTASIPTGAQAIYTCPMHPEIRRDQPGACPKCGMALEPEMPSLDAAENPELKDITRRFWWTLPLTIVVTVLAMFAHRWEWFAPVQQSWTELILATPIVWWAGKPIFARGAQSLAQRSPNMWTLIGLGTGAAYVYSVIASVAPQLFPASFVSMGRVNVYFEAAAVIVSLTLLGQLLELKARAQTSAAIKSLLGLSPKTARRINADDTEADVPLTLVQVNDR